MTRGAGLGVVMVTISHELNWLSFCRMARFASLGESEPLMRLERPSTASSQTTAHIINSCFNQILSHKQFDPKDISNLAVSKRESSQSDFQDHFVDKLTKVKII